MSSSIGTTTATVLTVTIIIPTTPTVSGRMTGVVVRAAVEGGLRRGARVLGGKSRMGDSTIISVQESETLFMEQQARA